MDNQSRQFDVPGVALPIVQVVFVIDISAPRRVLSSHPLWIVRTSSFSEPMGAPQILVIDRLYDRSHQSFRQSRA